jgi:hypothetical protein
MIYLLIITIIRNKSKQLVSSTLLLTTMCMNYPQQIHTLHLCRTHVTLNRTHTISRYVLLYWTLFRFRVLTLINSIWRLWISNEYISTDLYTQYIAAEYHLLTREKNKKRREIGKEKRRDDMGKERGTERKGNRTRGILQKDVHHIMQCAR